MKKIICVILVLSSLAMTSFSQGKKDTLLPKLDMSFKLQKPKFKPRSSFIGVQALDTIDTQTPDIKIIIYANNTWNYYRDPSAGMAKTLFTDNWDTTRPNPFNVDIADLPYRISLWIVDNIEDFHCPNAVKVYSKYGIRHGRRHMGVDLPLKVGTPVGAAFAGKVRMSKYYSGYGNLVVIRHLNGLETFYAHLSKRLVEVGDWVEPGQIIGFGGSTGRSTGPHLHFETRYKGYSFDPQWLIDFEKGELRSTLFVLKKIFLTPDSKYVPDSDEIEYAINEADAKDMETERSRFVADSIAFAKAKKEAEAVKYYTVKSGDTLASIAKRNRTTVSAICRLNKGLTTTTILKVGRKLRVR